MAKHVKSFTRYLREHEDSHDLHINDVVEELMKAVKTSNIPESNKYTKIAYIERIEDPYTYDLDFMISRNPNPDFKTDDHFSTMEWEHINFKKNGFCVDGNVYMDEDEDVVPEIEITVLIDPNREPECHQELFYKLNDVVTHEVHHLTQVGWNRKTFRVGASPMDVRKDAKSSYKYFLLPDEIEAMVKGMYRKAKLKDINLDEVFHNYLSTFVEHGYISQEEYDKVITEWIKYALIHHPGAKISDKFSHIINKQ